MQQKTYNTLEEAQDVILQQNPKNIFLVTGRKSFESSGAKSKISKLLSKNITQFYDFSPNPKLEDVKRGIEEYKDSNANLIIAVGGGSVMDMAKLIKGLATEKDPQQSILDNKISGSNVPMIAVPTTSGSGSESTPFAVVYVEGKKYSLQHDTLLPDEIVLDATLTDSMSPKQTAITGMDALAQSIESYWSVNSTEESKSYSDRAIKLTLENLGNTVNNPNDVSRKNMLTAANLAGKAIAIAKTTACHAISYPMTSHFGVPHGQAVALTLGEVLEYNSKVSEDDCIDGRGVEYVQSTMNELLSLLGVANASDGNKKIKNLMQSIGLETELSKLGVDNLQIILQEGFNPQRMKNNPRRLTLEGLSGILKEIK